MGTPEVILIAIVIFVVFGASKLPQLGDGLGKAIRGFQKAVSGADEKPVKPLPAESTPPSSEQK